MSASLEDLFGNERPGVPDPDEGEEARALVVAAHPDDADFGAGGVGSLLAQAGWEVRYIVVTDGSKGSEDPSFTPETLVTTRKKEQRLAAESLGVTSVRFLDYPDGELTYSRTLLGAVTREIREFRPFAVYTHDPEPVIINNSFVNHSDHRITGLVTVDAVYPTARDRMNFPEQLQNGITPHKVRELYLWGSNEPNIEINVSAVITNKIDALLAHSSQFGDRDDFVELVSERWSDKDGRYLERFRRVVLFR